jgi:hypothetical protein
MRPLAERATPARVPLRPLTPAELDHALSDLVGDDTHAVLRLQPSRVRSGIETPPSEDFAWAGARSDLLFDAMYGVATGTVERSEPLRACAEGSDAGCVRAELGSLATRAWRRAPSDEELDRLEGLASSVAADFDRREGLTRALQAVLLHPELLYLTSIGTDAGLLDDVELAARLSFFLWATVPDETLLGAAARGELSDASGIERQARRMIRDPRAGRAMSSFVTGWVGGYDLGAMPRVDDAWGGELVSDMTGETEHFVLGWFQGEDRALSQLFDTDHTYVTPRLAALYGITIPEGAPSTDGFARVTRTAGLLTQGGFLASHAVSGGSSPTLRGRWVLNRIAETLDHPRRGDSVSGCGVGGGAPNGLRRGGGGSASDPPEGRATHDSASRRTCVERVICLPIDGPPASALAMARAFTADMTTREWHEAIFATPGCNSCHSRLEPPGFAFETFDQIGRVRHEERGEPIRTHTTISSGTDLDGRYESEADFSEAIATARSHAIVSRVRGCSPRSAAPSRTRTDASSATSPRRSRPTCTRPSSRW